MSDYPRKDLQHPFQCDAGREDVCSFFHNWLWVKCLLPESDPVHVEAMQVAMTDTQRERQDYAESKRSLKSVQGRAE